MDSRPGKILLDALGVPPATARLVTYFARNPTARPTIRELQRTLGVGSASVQRDLERLVSVGALRYIPDGRSLRYAPRMVAVLWDAVRSLFDPVPRSATRVREVAAEKYGVDISLLRSTLERSVEERIQRLDADAALLTEARKKRR
jgi:hypothetical protein